MLNLCVAEALYEAFKHQKGRGWFPIMLALFLLNTTRVAFHSLQTFHVISKDMYQELIAWVSPFYLVATVMLVLQFTRRSRELRKKHHVDTDPLEIA